MSGLASDSPYRRDFRTALTAAAIIAFALFAHREVPACALLGVDAYPQILTARIQSWSDFFDTFRETLGDGQIAGAYFRPVQNLLLAANYAVGGLDPRPYQWTNWLAVGCLAALLFLTTARILGPPARLAPFAAAALVSLHPVLVSIVHGPATRSELLVVTFLLAALWILPVTRATCKNSRPEAAPRPDLAAAHGVARWPRCVAAAIFALLAAGSKDTGAVAPLLVFIHQFGLGPVRGVWARTRHAMCSAVPSACAIGLYLIVRAQIVGGVGGMPGNEKVYWYVFSSTAPPLGPAIACPGLPLANFSQTSVAAGLGGLLALAGMCAWFGAGAGGEVKARRTLLVLGAVWSLCSVPLMGFVQHFFFYYAMFPLVGVGLVVAAAFDGLRAARTRSVVPVTEFSDPHRAHAASAGPSMVRRALSIAGVVLALPIVVGGLFASPLWHDYPQYDRASRLHRQVYAQLESAIGGARAGEIVRRDVVRRISDPRAADRSQPVASITVPFAIEAWARMRFPETRVRVCESAREPFPPPIAGAIVIVIRYVEPDSFEAIAGPSAD